MWSPAMQDLQSSRLTSARAVSAASDSASRTRARTSILRANTLGGLDVHGRLWGSQDNGAVCSSLLRPRRSLPEAICHRVEVSVLGPHAGKLRWALARGVRAGRTDVRFPKRSAVTDPAEQLKRRRTRTRKEHRSTAEPCTNRSLCGQTDAATAARTQQVIPAGCQVDY